MTLPDFTNRQYISAGVLNEWQRQLLNGCAWCAAPVGTFAMLPGGAYSEQNDGTPVTVWSGNILYTGASDTFDYLIYLIANSGTNTANAVIYVNSVAVATIDDTTGHWQSGSVTLSGLTDNTVYTVEVKATRSGTSSTVNLTVDVHWLGISFAPTYTALTTWSTGNTVSITNIHKIRTNILALMSGAPAMPVAPTVVEFAADTPSTDDPINVWRGYIKHTHNRLRVRFTGRADNGKGEVKVYYNGTLAHTFTQTNGETTQDKADIDLSGLGLTVGTRYAIVVSMNRAGTSATDIYMECRVILVEENSTYEPTATTPFVMGDTLAAADLNLYNTNINRFHPGAASPDAPGYYDQPAVRIGDDNRYTIQHRRGWLRYDYSGAGTPEITSFDESAPEASLPTDANSYLLANAIGLGMGSYYTIDDCDYAQESDYAET